MRTGIREAEAELVKFLSEYRLSSVFGQGQAEGAIGKIFKKSYCLLIFQERFAIDNLWTNKKKSETFRLYFREFISDLLQSLMLAAQGIYKPAFFSLRSAIENFFKCIAIAEDQNVLSVTSTYDLIDIIKDSLDGSDVPLSKRYFIELRDEYKNLCQYVHTASAGHMALVSIVGCFPRYISADAEKHVASFRRIASNALNLTCIIRRESLASLHHTRRDSILDNLPKGLKQNLSAI